MDDYLDYLPSLTVLVNNIHPQQPEPLIGQN